MNSDGPIFYSQERLTKHERPFRILKFRTMPVDAEKCSGPLWASEEDGRTDLLGNFLRLTRIDELPQLINILKGDMSLIGPRPERACFVEKFKTQGLPHYEDRHLIRSGWMSYSHVVHPNLAIDQIASRTESDLYYITNWSIGLELWIVKAVFCMAFPIAFRSFSMVGMQLKGMPKSLWGKLFPSTPPRLARTSVFSSSNSIE
jgi:putative colanic acid biosynthesis UDP-glucose lipid carrier transferase